MRMVQVDSMARILLCLAVLSSKSFSEENLARLSSYSFGTLSDGREVNAFVLKNARGMSVQILDSGRGDSKYQGSDSSQEILRCDYGV